VTTPLALNEPGDYAYKNEPDKDAELMSTPSVAVIDIGSNSIKLLVAARSRAGELVTLKTAVEETRISRDMSGAGPELSETSMDQAALAVARLLAGARRFFPVRVVIAATSAVRDAANGPVFGAKVHAATGLALRILSGREEAEAVGRGVAEDPSLEHLSDFYLFDLGGGSLECLSFRRRRVDQIRSLPLGCVRLTERFISDRDRPVTAQEAHRLAAHVRASVGESGFAFTLPEPAIAVATGGTATTVRALLAAQEQVSPARRGPSLALADWERLYTKIAALPLDERRKVPGLPASRADIFPAALATMIEVARLGRLPAYLHSFYNVRYGLAAEELAKLP
jgi:exopolyphosphatase / guanosine-5'-triphosphate,3'-diphosphate pyrophosphatase